MFEGESRSYHLAGGQYKSLEHREKVQTGDYIFFQVISM